MVNRFEMNKVGATVCVGQSSLEGYLPSGYIKREGMVQRAGVFGVEEYIVPGSISSSRLKLSLVAGYVLMNGTL